MLFFYSKGAFFLIFGCKVTKKYLILHPKAVLNCFKRIQEFTFDTKTMMLDTESDNSKLQNLECRLLFS